MNADMNRDMQNIVDRKIAEIFKKYSTDYEAIDDKEDNIIKTDIQNLNKKIDVLTDLVIKLVAGNAYTGIGGDQQQASTTSVRKPKQKKEEKVFIPELENSDMTISNGENKTKTIYSNDMSDILTTLNKLK